MSVSQVRELFDRIAAGESEVRKAAQQPSAEQRQIVANTMIGIVRRASDVLGVEAPGAPELQADAVTFAQIAEENPAAALSCLDRLAKLVALERKRGRIEACLPRTQQPAYPSWAWVWAAMALPLAWPAQLLAWCDMPPYCPLTRFALAVVAADVNVSLLAWFYQLSAPSAIQLAAVGVIALVVAAVSLLSDPSQRQQDIKDLEEGEAEVAQLAAQLGELNLSHFMQFVRSAAAKVSSTKRLAVRAKAVLGL